MASYVVFEMPLIVEWLLGDYMLFIEGGYGRGFRRPTYFTPLLVVFMIISVLNNLVRGLWLNIKRNAMNLMYNIQGQRFMLQYQNCSYGPEGLVVLPAGEYYVTRLEESSYFGPVWVWVKQDGWSESIRIGLDDFNRFWEYRWAT